MWRDIVGLLDRLPVKSCAKYIKSEAVVILLHCIALPVNTILG